MSKEPRFRACGKLGAGQAVQFVQGSCAAMALSRELQKLMRALNSLAQRICPAGCAVVLGDAGTVPDRTQDFSFYRPVYRPFVGPALSNTGAVVDSCHLQASCCSHFDGR